MSTKFLFALAAGLAAVALLIGGVFYAKRGNHLDPTGQILKVRAAAVDDRHSIAIADLRLRNDSDVAIEVRTASLSVDLPDGRHGEGSLLAGADAKQVFQYYPALGEAYNEPLIAGSRVPARATKDWMLAARFDVSEQDLDQRRKLSAAIQDRSLVRIELSERRP